MRMRDFVKQELDQTTTTEGIVVSRLLYNELMDMDTESEDAHITRVLEMAKELKAWCEYYMYRAQELQADRLALTKGGLQAN